MDEYQKQEIESFFEHGELLIKEHRNDQETISKYDDVIICTEYGTIAFLLQTQNLMVEMTYHSGFDLIQYCTDYCNRWTEKIIWITYDYWKTIRGGFTEIEP